VLFEMLSGRRPFEGATVTDTLVSVLEREPDWTVLPSATPDAVHRLLHRCLAKDPARRLRDIGDASVDLTASQASGPSRPPDRRSVAAVLRHPGVWMVMAALAPALVFALGAAVSGWWWPPRDLLARHAMRLDTDLGPDVSLEGPVLISPNGERLVFKSNGRLFSRRLSQATSLPLAGTENVTAANVFFSPDSRFVAFEAGGILKRVSLDDGAVMTIAEVSDMRGGTWSEDDTIVFGAASKGLQRIRLNGGRLETLTTLEPGEFTHRRPQFLPGGRAERLFRSLRRRFRWDRVFDVRPRASRVCGRVRSGTAGCPCLALQNVRRGALRQHWRIGPVRCLLNRCDGLPKSDQTEAGLAEVRRLEAAVVV
jgi:hypothetical protein